MKKLLKSKICGSVNSSPLKSQQMHVEPKKKKKEREKTLEQKRRRFNNLNPNGYYIVMIIKHPFFHQTC